MTAASTGINENTARAAGLDYDKVILSPASKHSCGILSLRKKDKNYVTKSL